MTRTCEVRVAPYDRTSSDQPVRSEKCHKATARLAQVAAGR